MSPYIFVYVVFFMNVLTTFVLENESFVLFVQNRIQIKSITHITPEAGS